MVFAQSSLPPTTPTTLPAASPTAPPPSSPIVATSAVRRAEVSYVQGQLEIAADDSSLNQILREIGRLTGMTITGGVADQRVFGKYGPAAPPDILTSLLQGTGSNMLFLNGESNAPAQLILTPQQGSVTPPNPNAPAFDDDTSEAQTPSPSVPSPGEPASRPAYAPGIPIPGRGRGPIIQSQDSPALSTATTADPGTNPPPSDNPPSPNGVQTPQQIYQQLLQLQTAQPKH